MKKISFKKSFTLIELMTVIGIIAILAGLMLVGYNIFFEEADIGSSMRFDSSIHHSLGYALVGDWKLDDNAANSTVVDTSGNGNDGTFYNNENNYTSENSVDGVNGRALYLDGSGNEYIYVSNNLIEDIKGYTISVWVKSEGLINNYNIPAGHHGGQGWYFSHFNSNDEWRFGFETNQDEWHHLHSGNIVEEDKWYYLVGIHNKESQKFYVNSKKREESSYNGFDETENYLSITIGGEHSTVYPFTGSVDQVRVYKDALSTSQIKQQYYTGLQRLYKKGLISREEYIKRIVKK